MLFLSGKSLPDTGRRVGEVGVVWVLVLVLAAVSTAVLTVALEVAVLLTVAVLTVSC